MISTTLLRRAVSHLKQGGIVAAATESYFGLFVDARNRTALDAVFQLKGRAASRGVALIVPSREVWSTWVDEIPALALAFVARFWPGPLTIALPAAPHVDQRVIVDGTLGARLPGPSVAARLVAEFGDALTATSANLTGAHAATNHAAVSRSLGSLAGDALLVLPGSCPGGAPSTVVRVTADSYHVVRAGAVSAQALAAAKELATGR